MPRTKIRYDDYKVKAFLDTNIILEGRPLAELPWEEIDAEGPIIALLTPTAIKEVDSKKQDGRIGKRAREFNKLIAPVAAGGPPIVIRESGPRVELALAYAVRIPWDQHDDLDPDDGDSCIVAEALHASDISPAGKLLVSQDIKPISFAANYDLETVHVAENWLRQMEPGPADKEVQRLKSKLAEYEANEPQFDIMVEMSDGEPVVVVRIHDLAEGERSSLERKILNDNPSQNQARGAYSFSVLGDYDDTYDDRYDAYRKRVPIYVGTYEQRLERMFNQARIKLKISNTGKVQAENLLVEVNVSSGWLHDRYVWVSPGGPAVPKPRHDRLAYISSLVRDISTMPDRVGRHEVAFKDAPRWRSWFSATCQDFRHGQEWSFEGVVGFDARAPDAKIIVTVTASNYRGKAQKVKQIERKLGSVHISKLINVETLRFAAQTPIDEVIRRKDCRDAIDWKAFPVDEDDEVED